MKKELCVIPLLLSPVFTLQAHAEIYMSDSEAALKIFPSLKFTRTEINLSTENVEKIEKMAGTVRSKRIVAWKAESGEIVFIDQVLGKHEFITYAVGIQKNGKVAGIEVLEYREPLGQGVIHPEWRKQFTGKDKQSSLILNDDIKNMSGATLSSAHITSGVKRLLCTYEIIHAQL